MSFDTEMFKLVALGMMSSIIFGLVDAFNFLIVEDIFESIWNKIGVTEVESINLLNNGLSTAISILIALSIDKYFLSQFKMFKHPALESLGIIIATIIVLSAVKLYHWITGTETKMKAFVVTLYNKVVQI
jgi:hypothetical protein